MNDQAKLTPRTLRIVGTGAHHLTRVYDADTGEDIGSQLCIERIQYEIGDPANYPKARLIIEIGCPVILEIKGAREAE